MRFKTPIVHAFPTLAFLRPAIAASNDGSGAVFVYNDTPEPFVFALNLDQNGQDMYFHISASSKYSWMAVGTGSEMANSLMMIVYASEDGQGVTISPRAAMNGESEPTYWPSISCEKINGTGSANPNTVAGEVMTAQGVCRNIPSWKGGQLDLQSSSQPFIFALGPNGCMKSDSPTAPMERHSLYGRFTVDMTQANGGQVPLPSSGSSYETSGTSSPEDVNTDFGQWAPLIHGIVMCIAFVLLFPLGSLLLRVAESVRLHWICQCIALILVLLGSAGGLYLSMGYNRSRNFNTAHQIVGILLFLALVAQLGLGWVHHMKFRKYRRPTVLGKIHLYLGPLLIIIGLINAPLGFDLGLHPSYNIAYGILVIIVAIIFIVVRLLKWRRSRKQPLKDDGQYWQVQDQWENVSLRPYGAARSMSPSPAVSPARPAGVLD